MKLQLHTRLLLSLLVLLVIGFTMLGLILLNDAKIQISEHHETLARHHAKTLAESSLDGLVSEDYEILEKLVHSSLPSEKYAYAALIRTDGKILTHTNLLLIGEYSATVNTHAEGTSRQVYYKHRPVLEVIYPALINKQILANAHIAYYLDTEYILQNDTVTRIIIVLVISLALIFIATHFVTRSITVPIEKLTTCISMASLNRPIEIDPSITSRTDEIGDLANSFQNVSNSLQNSHHELTNSLLSNKAIVDNAIDGILVVDDKGIIESINSAGERIFGYSSAELVGQNISTFVPDTHLGRNDNYPQQHSSTKSIDTTKTRREVEGVRKDGSRVPLEIAIDEIQTDERILYTSTIRDISTRYEYEQALVLAKSSAEDGSRIKSEFLANISHELRTPMNGILGYLDLLSMEELSQVQEKYVNTAAQSAEELLEIINNILEFTRLEKHDTELEISTFSLRDIVASLISDFKDYRHNNIELVSHIENTLPDRLSGDPSRIRNIIRHFMSNAYKFTKQGKIAVNIDVLQLMPSKVEINVEVRDTGIGIEASNRSRIFDLFTQADGSSTRRYGGTGIGLALCKKMVLSMSGQIGVDSKLDEGSTFWFSVTLDIVDAEQEPEILTTQSKPETREEETNYAPIKNILIVEDNPFNQDLLLEMLKAMNYEAEVVGNGQLAVDTLSKKSYDLILMDCQMPIMNGFEATLKIREMEKQHTPIIAITAHALDGDRELCIESGMDDYMSKPFSKSELDKMMRKWLS